MSIKENLITFPKDCLRIVIAVTNTILAVSMIMSPEPRNFFFWFTLGFRIITVPVSLFVGNRGLWIMYFIFCNVKALDITYNNYTVVALLTVLFALLPNISWKKAVFVGCLYITDVFIVAGLHNKSGFYIYTHLMLTAQFCCAMWKQKVLNKKESIRTVILTCEEMEIIRQIREGKLVKQIEGYSEATVYRKLSEARERNGFRDNEELLKSVKR